MKKQQQHYYLIGVKGTYFMDLEGDFVIDATFKGNLARFINHSCEPNCETQKWVVNGRSCVGIFSKRQISVGEEICYDYQLSYGGKILQRCHCGSKKCRGYLSTDNTSNQDDMDIFDSDNQQEDDRSSWSIQSATTLDSFDSQALLNQGIKRKRKGKKSSKNVQKRIQDSIQDIDMRYEDDQIPSIESEQTTEKKLQPRKTFKLPSRAHYGSKVIKDIDDIKREDEASTQSQQWRAFKDKGYIQEHSRKKIKKEQSSGDKVGQSIAQNGKQGLNDDDRIIQHIKGLQNNVLKLKQKQKSLLREAKTKLKSRKIQSRPQRIQTQEEVDHQQFKKQKQDILNQISILQKNASQVPSSQQTQKSYIRHSNQDTRENLVQNAQYKIDDLQKKHNNSCLASQKMNQQNDRVQSDQKNAGDNNGNSLATNNCQLQALSSKLQNGINNGNVVTEKNKINGSVKANPSIGLISISNQSSQKIAPPGSIQDKITLLDKRKSQIVPPRNSVQKNGVVINGVYYAKKNDNTSQDQPSQISKTQGSAYDHKSLPTQGITQNLSQKESSIYNKSVNDSLHQNIEGNSSSILCSQVSLNYIPIIKVHFQKQNKLEDSYQVSIEVQQYRQNQVTDQAISVQYMEEGQALQNGKGEDVKQVKDTDKAGQQVNQHSEFKTPKEKQMKDDNATENQVSGKQQNSDTPQVKQQSKEESMHIEYKQPQNIKPKDPQKQEMIQKVFSIAKSNKKVKDSILSNSTKDLIDKIREVPDNKTNQLQSKQDILGDQAIKKEASASNSKTFNPQEKQLQDDVKNINQGDLTQDKVTLSNAQHNDKHTSNEGRTLQHEFNAVQQDCQTSTTKPKLGAKTQASQSIALIELGSNDSAGKDQVQKDKDKQLRKLMLLYKMHQQKTKDQPNQKLNSKEDFQNFIQGLRS